MEQGIFDVLTQILPNGIKLITIKKDTQLASLHAAIKIGSLLKMRMRREYRILLNICFLKVQKKK